MCLSQGADFASVATGDGVCDEEASLHYASWEEE